MSLMESRRHSQADLDAWRSWQDEDRVRSRLGRMDRLAEQAANAIRRWAEDSSGGYCSVSWGRDSVCVAHLAAETVPHMPLVWARCVDGHEQPDSLAVRDAFLADHPDVTYHEWTYEWRVPLRPAPGWDDPAHHQDVLAEMADDWGDRYISGVRADESAARRRGLASRGLVTDRTCSPIGWWRSSDVWAYLEREGLPVHAAYAMTMGGTLSRDRVRVHCLGTRGGDHAGRVEWEDHYYRDVLAATSQDV